MKIGSDRRLLRGLRKNGKAISPAISTVIITAAVVVMLLVTIVFANNYLQGRIAQNEFSAAEQFMQTTALQLDDVSWTIGRTQTIRYTSTFGQVNFQAPALNYTVFVNNVPLASYITGVLFFNMPTNKYSVGNGYYQGVIPASNSSFLQQGTSAPVGHVFVVEIVPMKDGNYIRIVVAPSIRMLNSTISTGNSTTNYYNFYLPCLAPGASPHVSQTVTLQGYNVSVATTGSVSDVRIHVDFPQSIQGFDNNFFHFETQDVDVPVPAGSVLEFYTSEVIVSLGLQI
jgi:hypothetical protein